MDCLFTDQSSIQDLLYSLGITAKYTGFFYTSSAVHLALQSPERLLLITKWLYPEVARQYGTTWYNVEKNIRFVAAVAWELRRDKLTDIAKFDLKCKPNNSQFISILVKYFQTTTQTSEQPIPFISQIS